MTQQESIVPRAIVGVTETCERIAGFYGDEALRKAEEYVGTLPDAAKGIYYIDYPCDGGCDPYGALEPRTDIPEGERKARVTE